MEGRFASDRPGDITRIAIGLLTLAVLCLIPFSVVANLPPLCLFHWLGIEHCPGCGITRAASLLAHGQIMDAVWMNWRIVLIAPLCLWLFGSAVVRVCVPRRFGADE
ncbi:DUF2752 domain-containing protein [bacterium]|nr:DUF2752 domain-containing protein [bacterium]